MSRLWTVVFVLFASQATSKTLDNPTRVGILLDPVGQVLVQSRVAPRSQIVGDGDSLLPGDRVVCDRFYPGVVRIKLANGGVLTLGPSSVLDVAMDGGLRLVSGEVHVVAPVGGTLRLNGPSDSRIDVADSMPVIASGDNLRGQSKPFDWFLEYEAGNPLEALGSLSATVDGKVVPLALARHAVAIDVRDGVALTTIESSYRNTTEAELEGVFEFPLPADAVVSQFGVYFGDRLVLADIAEKERARRAYETLMKENKDPGLLEIAEGNKFRTRIFPIPALGEKKVRISYTQVIPFSSGTWSYLYPLASASSRDKSVDEVIVKFTFSSLFPVAGVSGPDFCGVPEVAGGSVVLNCRSQKGLPTEDFAVDLRLDTSGTKPSFRYHVQGTDGYFLVSAIIPDGRDGGTPAPTGDGGTPAPTGDGGTPAPTGDGIDLVIWADTSASLDSDRRLTQEKLVYALVSGLGARDRFRLVACDSVCDWASGDFATAGPESGQAAVEFLRQRPSLGWTDLSLGLRTVSQGATKDTVVVYIGDGLETSTVPDPGATSEMVRRTMAGFPGRVFVAGLGAVGDAIVLRTIAQVGRGMAVTVASPSSATRAARRILSGSLTEPVADLALKFTGLKTAAIVPLVDSPEPGGQMLWVGRVQPSTVGQAGAKLEIVGSVGGDSFVIDGFDAIPASEDSSFLSRIWASGYITGLLETASVPRVKDEIIGLSLEYGVITPYTSFVVITSDADRNRFGVRRLYRMGDGERFFAEGVERAEEELARTAVAAARGWRLGFRRDVVGVLLRPDDVVPPEGYFYDNLVIGGENRHFAESTVSDVVTLAGSADSDGDLGGGQGGGGGRYDSGLVEQQVASEFDGKKKEVSKDSRISDEETVSGGWNEGESEELRDRSGASQDSPDSVGVDGFVPMDETLSPAEAPLSEPAAARGESIEVSGKQAQAYYRRGPAKGPRRSAGTRGSYLPGMGETGRPVLPYWLSVYVPSLADGFEPGPIVEPGVWPGEVMDVLKRVDRRAFLSAAEGVLINERSAYYSYGIVARPTSTQERRLVRRSDRYALRVRYSGMPVSVDWFDGKVRGRMHESLGIAVTREASKSDGLGFPLDLPMYVVTDLASAFAGYSATLSQGPRPGTSILRFEEPDNYAVEMIIDDDKSLVLEVKTLYRGKVQSVAQLNSAVQVGNVWMPSSVSNKDGEGLIVGNWEYSYTLLNAASANIEYAGMIRPLANALVLPSRLPTIPSARKAIASGSGQAGDYASILSLASNMGDWSRTLEALEGMSRTSPGASGLEWIRVAILVYGRRGDSAIEPLVALAEQLPGRKLEDESWVAQQLVQLSQMLGDYSALSRVLKSTRPVFERARANEPGVSEWASAMFDHLQTEGRAAEAFEVLTWAVQKDPYDANLAWRYLEELRQKGETDQAMGWIDNCLSLPGVLPHEAMSFNSQKADTLLFVGRLDDLLSHLISWDGGMPSDSSDSQPASRLLAALRGMGRDADMDGLINLWVDDAVSAGEQVTPYQAARMYAAVGLMTGQGWGLYSDRLDPKYVPLIMKALMASVSNDGLSNVFWIASRSQSIIEYLPVDVLRKAIVDKIESDHKLDGASLSRLAGLYVGTGWLSDQERTEVAELVVKRGRALGGNGQEWEQAVLSLLGARGLKSERLEFLRARVESADKDRVDAARGMLFYALLSFPLTERDLAEAEGLLPELGAASPLESRLAVQVAAMDRLALAMVDFRFEQVFRAPPDVTNRRSAAQARIEANEEAVLWATERLARSGRGLGVMTQFFDVKALGMLAQAGLRSRESFGPALVLADSEKPRAETGMMGTFLEERSAAVVVALAVRLGDVESVGRARGLLQSKAKSAGVGDARTAWVIRELELLVAVDDVDGLSELLGNEARRDENGIQWDVVLACVRAEAGDIGAARVALEKAAKREPLPGDALAVLQALRLADGGKANVSVEDRLSSMGEQELQSEIGRRMAELRKQGVVTRIPPDVLAMVEALVRKAQYPQNMLYVIIQLYETVNDYRLIAMVPMLATGVTPGQAWTIMRNFRYSVSQITSEATLSEASAVGEAQALKASDPAHARIYWAFVALLEAQASAIPGSGRSHAAKAKAAIESVVPKQGLSLPGEALGAGDLLLSMGVLEDRELAQSQREAVVRLLAKSQAGSIEQKSLAAKYIAVMQMYGLHEQAIKVVRPVVESWRRAHGGVMGAEGWDLGSAWVGLLDSTAAWSDAEAFLMAEIASASGRHLDDSTASLWELYSSALGRRANMHGGGVALLRHMESQFWHYCEPLTYDGMYRLFDTHIYAIQNFSRSNLSDGIEILNSFVRALMLPNLDKTGRQRFNIVMAAARAMVEFGAVESGIVFVLDALDNMPDWYELVGGHPWASISYAMGDWRHRVRLSPGTEKRLFDRLVVELRRELTGEDPYANGMMYRKQYGEFWQEREKAFVDAAMAIGREHLDSTPWVRNVAYYLMDGLSRPKEAAQLLGEANQSRPLTDSGLRLYARALSEAHLYAESVPILSRLMEHYPTDSSLMVSLVVALAESGDVGKARSVMNGCVERLKQDGIWAAEVAATLGRAAEQAGLGTEAVSLLREAVQLYVPGQASSLYRTHLALSASYNLLGDCDSAFESALSAAALAPQVRQSRQDVVAQADAIMDKCYTSESFVRGYEAKEAELGATNPLFHGRLGIKLLRVGQRDGGLLHLEKALAAEPYDSEVRRAWLEGLGSVGGEVYAEALLSGLQYGFSDAETLADLSEALVAVGRQGDALRSVTTGVEFAPDTAGPRISLAEHYVGEGHLELAARQLEAARSIAPNDVARLLEIAEVYRKAGRTKDADDVLRYVLAVPGATQRQREQAMELLKSRPK